MKNSISLIIKGMFIGIANIIPGMSGGTVAFVTGVYQDLNEAIAYFLLRPQKRLHYILFLLRIFIGAVLGLLLFAKAISYLLGVKTAALGGPLPMTFVPTYGFFLGLIIGSLPVLFKMQKDTKFSLIRGFFFILGAGLLLALARMPQRQSIDVLAAYPSYQIGPFTWQVLSSYRTISLLTVGFLAAFTMIIPGISGSALLVALGEYGSLLNYINERSISHLTFFGIGVVGGILIATLLMAKLLERWPALTFYAILGLVSASCLEIIKKMIEAKAPLSMWLVTIVTVALGIVIALQSRRLAPQASSPQSDHLQS